MAQDMTTAHPEFTQRTELLLGADAMARLAESRVVLFGVGGVGSWCAEALARTGVGHITIIDSDTVAPSNINRQMVALHSTVGRPKVDVMAERMRDINPGIDVRTVMAHITPEEATEFPYGDYDVVIDAIDSIPTKCALILAATHNSRPRLVSSMGAALKSDPTKIEVANFDRVYGCPLARAIRTRFKRNGTLPRHKFKCVFSPELLANRADITATQTANGLKMPNGTLVYATATFGLTLAHLAITALLSINPSIK